MLEIENFCLKIVLEKNLKEKKAVNKELTKLRTILWEKVVKIVIVRIFLVVYNNFYINSIKYI